MPAIYCADVWCDSCADAIRERITREGGAPTNPNDERSYDSDEFPKYMPEDEEADSPQHCAAREECLEAETLPSGAKIGALLSHSLTSDGVNYVTDAIVEGGEVAEYWAREFSDYDVAPEYRVPWSDLIDIREALANGNIGSALEQVNALLNYADTI